MIYVHIIYMYIYIYDICIFQSQLGSSYRPTNHIQVDVYLQVLVGQLSSMSILLGLVSRQRTTCDS